MRKRHGDSGDSSSEEEVRGKGKGKAREEIVDETVAVDQAATVPSKAATKSKKKSKQADWNPNLLPTAPGSSSSDFDSSDSDNDSEVEAGPSSVKPKVKSRSPSPVAPTPAAAPTRQAVSSALKSVSTPGGALKSTSLAGGALKSVSVAGGALKKGSNGIVVAPRIEVRRKQRVVSHHPISVLELWLTAQVQPESEESDEEEDEDDDDDSGSGDDEAEDDDDEEDGSDDEDDDENEDDEEGENPELPIKKRSFGFKAWAQEQMDQITAPVTDLLNQPTSTTTKSEPKPSIPIPTTGHFVGPLGAQLNVPTTSLLDQKTSQSARPTLKRRPSVTDARMELPILAEEQPIVESILMNPVVVICGETGSGKTTQVPQMLYEHGFGHKGSGEFRVNF